MTSEVLVMR